MSAYKALFITLILIGLLTSCGYKHVRPSMSAEQKQMFKANYAQVQQKALAGRVFDYADYRRYELGPQHYIYLTKHNHPAHPAYVERKITHRLDQPVFTSRSGHGGSQQAFELWLAEFKDKDIAARIYQGPITDIPTL